MYAFVYLGYMVYQISDDDYKNVLRMEAEIENNPKESESKDYQCTNCLRLFSSLREGALCYGCWKQNNEAWIRFRSVSN
jgi:hypothetical protein